MNNCANFEHIEKRISLPLIPSLREKGVREKREISIVPETWSGTIWTGELIIYTGEEYPG